MKIGRLKDLARIDAFVEEKAVDLAALKAVLKRFDLMPAWDAYCAKAGKLELVGLNFMSRERQYPDITDILVQKAQGRRERASLSFAEKLAVLDKLREDLAPLVQARRARARRAEEYADRVLDAAR